MNDKKPSGPWPQMELKSTTGDLESNAKGSGARFDSGKPDYSFLFLDSLPVQLTDEDPELYADIDSSVHFLGEFQKSGDEHFLHLANDYLGRYCFKKAKEDGYFYQEAVIRVWEYGAKKYKAWNWAKGMSWSKVLACFARHYVAFRYMGEETDQESSEPHWAHCVCNLQMLMLYYHYYQAGNDLPFTQVEMSKDTDVLEHLDLKTISVVNNDRSTIYKDNSMIETT